MNESDVIELKEFLRGHLTLSISDGEISYGVYRRFLTLSIDGEMIDKVPLMTMELNDRGEYVIIS